MCFDVIIFLFNCLYMYLSLIHLDVSSSMNLKNRLNSLGKLQSNDSTRLSLNTFPPELEFRVDGAMKQEVVIQAFGMECTNGWVVADLFWHPSKAQILSDNDRHTVQQK